MTTLADQVAAALEKRARESRRVMRNQRIERAEGLLSCDACDRLHQHAPCPWCHRRERLIDAAERLGIRRGGDA